MLGGRLQLVVEVGVGSDTSVSSAATPTTAAQPTPPSVPISIPASTDGTSPDGSGCTPPVGDKLPDGIWFGVLKSVDPRRAPSGWTWPAGSRATAAQAAAGSATPVDNDYYVRNENPKIYALPTVDQGGRGPAGHRRQRRVQRAARHRPPRVWPAPRRS